MRARLLPAEQCAPPCRRLALCGFVAGELALRLAQLALERGDTLLQSLSLLSRLSLAALSILQQCLSRYKALYGHQGCASRLRGAFGALSGLWGLPGELRGASVPPMPSCALVLYRAAVDVGNQPEIIRCEAPRLARLLRSAFCAEVSLISGGVGANRLTACASDLRGLWSGVSVSHGSWRSFVGNKDSRRCIAPLARLSMISLLLGLLAALSALAFCLTI